VAAVYMAMLVVGGGAILLQLFLGHAFHGDVDHDGDVDGADGQLGEVASLFLSLRFWSFTLLGAGLVGTLCTLFGLLGGVALALVAAATGLVSGTGTALALRALKRASVATGGKTSDAVGLVGRVLVPPRAPALGKVRVTLHGDVTDLIAESEDMSLSAGDQVVVLEVAGAVVKVERAEALLLER
jgi:membrane protein implicated in regulation of membrane protease activity